MNSIAILYIAIGEYSCFWKGFYISMERFFLPNTQKEYYIFTDGQDIYAEEMENVHVIYQKNLGWPKNTFYRFVFFNSIKDELLKHDYVFFMNANIYCNQMVTEEEILPQKENYVFVLHHAYERAENTIYPYERNPDSEAYIPIGEGRWYITGGVIGGKVQAFIKLSEELARMIKKDEEKGITAVWHDESFINKYVLERDDCRILGVSYFYPELSGQSDLNCERKLVARDKRKYFNVAKLKSSNDLALQGDAKSLSDAYYYRLCFKWLILKSKNISVLDYFKSYKNIAIYSECNLGEILINEMEANNLANIIWGILNPDPSECRCEYTVCRPYEFDNQVDLIIVTEAYRYSEILTDISMFSSVPIVSIEDIINKLLIVNNLVMNTKIW